MRPFFTPPRNKLNEQSRVFRTGNQNSIISLKCHSWIAVLQWRKFQSFHWSELDFNSILTSEILAPAIGRMVLRWNGPSVECSHRTRRIPVEDGPLCQMSTVSGSVSKTISSMIKMYSSIGTPKNPNGSNNNRTTELASIVGLNLSRGPSGSICF